MKRTLVLLSLVVAGSALAVYFPSTQLVIDGKVASTNVIERDGVAYVPIKDVATALGRTVSKTGAGYEFSQAGGANQVNGVNGTVGNMLFNGSARFEVVKVIRTSTYDNQFSPYHEHVKPYPEGNEIIVLICKVKNGLNEAYMTGLPGGSTTALTDTEEHSYGCYMNAVDAPSNGVKLVPGAAVDFALTFMVPPGTKVKDLIYEPTFYGNPNASIKKFRVSIPNP